MLCSKRVVVRPMCDEDVPVVAAWAADPEKAAGDFQRFQIEHGRLLAGLYAQSGLVSRESGFLIVELAAEHKPIGFVRYATSAFPDPDAPNMDIGYAIAEPGERGHGYAGEALALLVDYLLAGYPVQRLSAYTDADNAPSRRLLERLGFECEGTMRQAIFHHGGWHHLCIYGLLRSDWEIRKTQA